MTENRTATISLKNLDGRIEQCSLEFEVSHESVIMKTATPSLGRQIWHGRDAFHALELFRRKIEPNEWRALGNGSRKAAYPSGMCRDMGRGFMLYPFPSIGSPTLKTFEPAPIEEIGTVEEQLAAWNNWLKNQNSKQTGQGWSFKNIWKRK